MVEFSKCSNCEWWECFGIDNTENYKVGICQNKKKTKVIYTGEYYFCLYWHGANNIIKKCEKK